MSAKVDAGSFRDRDGRVFYLEGEVYRTLSQKAYEDWRALKGTDFFADSVAGGQIVATEQVELPPDMQFAGSPWVAAIKHQTIPFISYPYEWSFNMLKDAALLHLDLLHKALAENFVLKDSSSYNIQWIGASPIFIDIPSFQPLVEGEPWVGYLQFCQLFLYPLLLTAYKDVPFQPWLRGSLEGITPESCNHLFAVHDLVRPGVFSNVFLQARLQRLMAASQTSLRRDLRAAGFGRELILRNVSRLRKLIDGLRWGRKTSDWSSYTETYSYNEADRVAKKRFVADVASNGLWKRIWDLGCNTGEFSLFVAEYADYVVAIDSDSLAIDRLFLELRRRGEGKILPLLGDLADPSPNLGWRGKERRSLAKRGKPDLVLALALVHHMVIGANVPLDEFVEWLTSLGSSAIVEFVKRNDPMVKHLLLNKEDNYSEYDYHHFEGLIEAHFCVENRLELSSGTRILYYLRSKVAQ